MDVDYTYQIHNTERGTDILVFKDLMFERKIFVGVSEYNPDCLAHILTEDFQPLFGGCHEFVAMRLIGDKEAKMVAVGKDFQILSISEYLSLYT